MKTEKIEMIQNFAKANKIGAKKLQAFITELDAKSGLGRKAKPETKVIRETLVQLAKDGDISGKVTAKQVMQALSAKNVEAEPVDVNNALRWVSTRHGICKATAETVKVPKGRPMVLWKF